MTCVIFITRRSAWLIYLVSKDLKEWNWVHWDVIVVAVQNSGRAAAQTRRRNIGGEELEKVALLLGRGVEDVDREVMGVIDEFLLKELLVWWKRRKELLGWL